MYNYKCKLCGRKLKNWDSIQVGLGPVCQKKYLDELYKNQITIKDYLRRKEISHVHTGDLLDYTEKY